MKGQLGGHFGIAKDVSLFIKKDLDQKMSLPIKLKELEELKKGLKIRKELNLMPEIPLKL